MNVKIERFLKSFRILDEPDHSSFWEHLRSPLYILVVLFLSILLIPSVFLAVIWRPLIIATTEKDESLGIISQTFFFQRI